MLLRAAKELGAKVLDAYALRLSLDENNVCNGVFCTRGTGLNDPLTEPSGVDECDTWKETYEAADTVVLAAGLGITELADEAGINLPLKGYTDGEWNRIRGVVAESEPFEKQILPYTVHLMDEPLYFHQFPSGCVKACFDFNGSPVEHMTKVIFISFLFTHFTSFILYYHLIKLISYFQFSKNFTTIIIIEN